MRRRTTRIAILLLAFAFAATVAAQTLPLYKRVAVNFENPVHVGDKVLPPGRYTISEQSKPTGAPGLLIEGENGSAVTPASTVETTQEPLPNETKVVLRELQGNYYLEQIWMAGQSAWHVELPEMLKNNQQARSIDVRATAAQ